MTPNIRRVSLTVLVLTVLWVVLSYSETTNTLVILSINDLHGQLEPFIVEKKFFGKTIRFEQGGIARLASAIQSLKRKYPGQVLTVSSGDNCMGKYWLKFDGEVTNTLLSKIGIDAATLGNHEFDRGESLLVESLKFVMFPVVVSNLEPGPNSPLWEKVNEYTVMERNGLRIGIIGLMTPGLSFITSSENTVRVNPDYISIAQKLAQRLKEKEQVDLVVALTHLGLDNDKKLAQRIPDIDVICGGHTHNFILEGKAITVQHQNEHSTIITQAGAYGEMLGMLQLTVKDKKIVKHRWKPVWMNKHISTDPEITKLLNKYKKQFPVTRVIAECTEPVDCRSDYQRIQETCIGNLICDALRERFKVDIAVQNGGGIRGDRIIPAGTISNDDIDTILPFGNYVIICKLNGKTVKNMLERSVAALPEDAGSFLQVSGIRFVADISKRPMRLKIGKLARPVGINYQGDRITKIEVMDENGHYVEIDQEKTYTLACNSFIAGGGNGYWMLETAKNKNNTGVLVSDTVKTFLENKENIQPRLDGRIVILKGR